ncbi:hypothetical protein FW774_07905 [Pedobacter sp. BS3]|uniref:hypothetical protein n=1 Tax=Pedobacter sp. BS3 TaxID=2567937 RepID=UPI0011EC7F08|nr:hypothetical protein [Pedobacter sp. BS3]TZF84890.1 hypothetical protein FW774_07905 [Pedobacter sp. BS3]
MKKIIVLTALTCVISLTTFAQKWKRVHLDSIVSVELPAGYTKTDTINQTIYSAISQFGNIIIVKTPDVPAKMPDIEKKKHLQNYYDNYLNKIKTSTKGMISQERDTMLGDLHVKDFTLEVDSGRGKQYRNFRILHENCATYTFEFLYEDVHKDLGKEDNEHFFNSIKFAFNPTVQSQFTAQSNVQKPETNNTVWIAAVAILIVIIILIIIWLSRRNKRNKAT